MKPCSLYTLHSLLVDQTSGRYANLIFFRKPARYTISLFRYPTIIALNVDFFSFGQKQNITCDLKHNLRILKFISFIILWPKVSLIKQHLLTAVAIFCKGSVKFMSQIASERSYRFFSLMQIQSTRGVFLGFV